jgi:hypothetical protein
LLDQSTNVMTFPRTNRATKATAMAAKIFIPHLARFERVAEEVYDEDEGEEGQEDEPEESPGAHAACAPMKRMTFRTKNATRTRTTIQTTRME